MLHGKMGARNLSFSAQVASILAWHLSRWWSHVCWPQNWRKPMKHMLWPKSADWSIASIWTGNMAQTLSPWCLPICMGRMITITRSILMCCLLLFAVFMKRKKMVQRALPAGVMDHRWESFCMWMIWPTYVYFWWIIIREMKRSMPAQEKNWPYVSWRKW